MTMVDHLSLHFYFQNENDRTLNHIYITSRTPYGQYVWGSRRHKMITIMITTGKIGNFIDDGENSDEKDENNHKNPIYQHSNSIHSQVLELGENH